MIVRHLRSPLTAILCLSSLLFSLQATANRPAMEEQEAAVDEPPPVEAPSAVELMMQEQGDRRVQTGDVVKLPPVEMQPGETLKIELLDSPRRGASMNSVQRQLGPPLSMSDSVGEPPITRWIYADRIVFFEYSTVLHVVPRK